MELKNDTTLRGFRIIEFKDTYQEKCSLQKSSAAGHDCVWLGIDTPKVYDGKPYARMHLTRAMVAALLPKLQFFIDTGELPTDDPEDDKELMEAEAARKRERMEAIQVVVDFLEEILEGEE